MADKLSPSIRKQKALFMSKDLAELSLTELKKLQRKIETELQKRERTSRSQLLKSMEKLAQEAGYSLSEVLGKNDAPAAVTAPKEKKVGKSAKKKAVKDKKPSVIKFRNPANPDQGWTGHGRKPNWVVEHLQNGGALEALAVSNPTT